MLLYGIRGAERMHTVHAELDARFTCRNQPDVDAFFAKHRKELGSDAVLQRHAGAFQRQFRQIVARADRAAVAVSRQFVYGVERFGKILLAEEKTRCSRLCSSGSEQAIISTNTPCAAITSNTREANASSFGKGADDHRRLLLQREETGGRVVLGHDVLHII